MCRLLGYGKAMEMTLTGETVGAAEALEIGLVNKVVEPEELETAVMALAENIARKSPYTVKVAKRAVRAALDLPFSEGVLAERSEFVALFDTEDKEIGVSAFLEARARNGSDASRNPSKRHVRDAITHVHVRPRDCVVRASWLGQGRCRRACRNTRSDGALTR